MKFNLQVKHKPADCPGMWEDSKLAFTFEGDKSCVELLEEAIKRALTVPKIRYMISDEK